MNNCWERVCCKVDLSGDCTIGTVSVVIRENVISPVNRTLGAGLHMTRQVAQYSNGLGEIRPQEGGVVCSIDLVGWDRRLVVVVAVEAVRGTKSL